MEPIGSANKFKGSAANNYYEAIGLINLLLGLLKGGIHGFSSLGICRNDYWSWS